MGVTTYDMEVETAVPAAKLYQSFILDGDTLVPKVAPQAMKSVDILEGDGGAGTVKLITFGEGSQFKSVKHKIDEVDKDNLSYSYSIIEGDILVDPLESISYHIKLVPTDQGGCILKHKSIYTCKGDVKIAEEDIKNGKEKAQGLFKAIEAYLLAN
ncbi:major allergen Pru ar 1-like [Cynara cardunculus var. scolymus]|uniref:major allergen Pru ar 1-like n=1 Tax=Cynara cardunculus var. scolymus TaxID=59895 RepID=UPI000D631050|nr:major allergen Pru ar 1-like [Cynara cardunculus var. scolymus]